MNVINSNLIVGEHVLTALEARCVAAGLTPRTEQRAFSLTPISPFLERGTVIGQDGRYFTRLTFDLPQTGVTMTPYEDGHEAVQPEPGSMQAFAARLTAALRAPWMPAFEVMINDIPRSVHYQDRLEVDVAHRLEHTRMHRDAAARVGTGVLVTQTEKGTVYLAYHSGVYLGAAYTRERGMINFRTGASWQGVRALIVTAGGRMFETHSASASDIHDTLLAQGGMPL